MPDVELACPGDVVAAVANTESGLGTYIDGDDVVASLCGVVHRSTGQIGKQDRVEVHTTQMKPVVPNVGDLVVCCVSRITKRACNVDIIKVGSQVLDTAFKGVVRVQDVRATEIDKVIMEHCYRPGDIIKAEVLSLGTMREYYLTTAKTELGVVSARSQDGFEMVPVSFETMRCVKTSQVEKRKVAKTLGTTA